MTIAKKIIINICLILVVSLAIIGFITVKKSKNLLEDNLETMTSQTLEQVDKGFSEYMGKMSQALNIVSKNIDIQDADYWFSNNEIGNYGNNIAYVENYLNAFKDVLSGVENLYYVYSSNGDVILDSKTTNETEYPFREKLWYKDAEANKDTLIYSKPYVDEITNEKILTISKSIENEDGVFIGVVGIDININELERYVNSITLLKEGYVLVSDNDGNIIINNGKSTFDSEQLNKYEFWNYINSEENNIYNWQNNKSTTYICAAENKEIGWKIIGFVNEEEIKDGLKSVKITIYISIIICILIGIIVSIILSKTITKNIEIINKGVGKISLGNFNEKIEIDASDEVGELAKNINVAIDNISQLLKDVEVIADEVYDSANSIATMSEETTVSVSEVTKAINNVSNGTANQAKAVENTTITVDDLSQNINVVDKNTQSILTLSEKTEKLSMKGTEILNELITKAENTRENTEKSNYSIKEMTESIKNINYISDAIAGITEQTGLLALNASIEAARAGEAGKGFAVVAEEIRKLSEESKNSTDAIKNIVNEVNTKSKLSSKIMEETVAVLIEQDKSIENTKVIFYDIADSINTLLIAIKQIDGLVSNMDKNKNNVVKEIDNISNISQDVASVSKEVTASVEEVHATMDELTQYADKLNYIAEKLKKN